MGEMQDPIDKAKESIEYIIGANTKLKRKKKTEEDSQKEQFINLITTLETINNRSFIMINEFDLNLTKYDENFYAAIDSLILIHFGADIAEIIFYYIYERQNPDGSINNLLDENKNIVPLENASDLWELVKELRIKLNKIKK